ncbi:MAG: tRNA uridine-5-carboxymethylaminomethyl(34) synthesis GTPase MnmE [Ignavibacteria bacterium]|nr:tRNA uridine-5-carboxymethylaminomethyl(34) synthesis GTPase MnmE [Ignavibacteria bacterium]
MSEIRKIIFAPLTLIGQSAISVIRVSGEGTFELVSNIVSKSFSRFELLDLSKFYPNTLHHVYIFDKDKNEAVDEVILSVFKGPHSYTGEDTVEISSHGGLYIYSKINDLLAKWGAVAAMPGEFTKRAFLNGKMDLAQAESVAELIKSRSEESRKLAFSQLTGEYSAKINSLRQELINYCSLLELELDFSEEGLEFVSRDELIMRIDTLINEFKRLVDTYYTGKLIRDGINLAIVGEPNVGKSSLFNYLLNYDRAIVSDIPGTTRDYISETLTIDGFPVNLIDTAGIRESSEEIEEAGIKKSISIRERADLLIVLKDATAGLGNDKISGDNSIIAYNKCDLLNGHSDFNCKDSLLI